MKKIFVIIGLLFLGITMFSQEINEDVSRALKTGNSELLSSYFASTIDLSINDVEEVSSKSQAKLILKDFFKTNTPTDFSIFHNRPPQNGTYFIIGNLTTNNGVFRTYIYFKESNGKYVIQEINLDLEKK